VDAWGVGCFIQEIFSGRKLTRTEELRELSRIPQVGHAASAALLRSSHLFTPQALQKHYQRLLGSAPARRLNPAALLESTLFQNKLVRFAGVGPGAECSPHSRVACRWTPSRF